MGWVQGLEPWTSGTTTRRSSQLGYTHRVSCAKALDYYCSLDAPMQAPISMNLRVFGTKRPQMQIWSTFYGVLWIAKAGQKTISAGRLIAHCSCLLEDPSKNCSAFMKRALAVDAQPHMRRARPPPHRSNRAAHRLSAPISLERTAGWPHQSTARAAALCIWLTALPADACAHHQRHR